MARAAQYAAAIVGLGLLIASIELWRRFNRITFVQTQYEPPSEDEWA